MAISSQHATGFLLGLGTTAFTFYLYKKNQERIDEFLRSQGIEVSSSDGKDPASMSLEELILEKERFEDLIAERQMAEAEPEKAT